LGVTIFGAAPQDNAIRGAEGGDRNGDGLADLIVASRWADSVGNLREEAGETDVIFGSTSLPSSIDWGNT